MKTLCAAILLAALLFQIDAVRAAPLAPPPRLPDNIIVVKDGCGVGFERIPGGACRAASEGPCAHADIRAQMPARLSP